MTRESSGVLVRQFEGLFTHGSASGLAEGSLLDRFVARRDENAFAIIVARHGPMVRGVCRRYLRDPNDADDAFQATFLILARKAGSIRSRERLGPWLHGVAYRVAARARREGSRRQPIADGEERGLSPLESAERDERSAFVHEEIERLPDKCRGPIVLCHLEGCTHDEAAARLGWPVGTVRGRLSRGRDRLRHRLEGRGLALSAAVPGEVVPEALMNHTVSAAIRFAAGQSATAVLSAQAAAWTAGGLHMLMMSKLKMVLLVVFVTDGVVVAGAGSMATVGAKEDGGPIAQVSKTDSAKTDHPVTAKIDAAEEIDDEEMARMEARLELLQLQLENKKTQLAGRYSQLQQLEDRIEGMGPETFPTFPKEVFARKTQELHKKTDVLRAEFLEGRTELSRLERQLNALRQRKGKPLRWTSDSALMKPAATEPKGDAEDEATFEKVTDLELQVELLKREIEIEKRQLLQSVNDVVQAEMNASSPMTKYHMGGGAPGNVDENVKKQQEEFQRKYREDQKAWPDILRKKYLADSAKLYRMERQLATLKGTAGVPATGIKPTPPDVEKRLSAIEATLQTIIKAVDKNAQGKP